MQGFFPISRCGGHASASSTTLKKKLVRKRIYVETRIQAHYEILFMTAFDECLKDFTGLVQKSFQPLCSEFSYLLSPSCEELRGLHICREYRAYGERKSDNLVLKS
jgi:hypothetical protein